jgi:hypothetical protein
VGTIYQQIKSADTAICENIALLSDNRALLSLNALAQLRNLVEGVAALIHTNSLDAEFNYSNICNAIEFLKSQGGYKYISQFHKFLQKAASHYTVDGDSSERLMLKYYEYLYRIRVLLEKRYNFQVLINLDQFPINLDPSLREYHEKISEKIEQLNAHADSILNTDLYYIHKIRPFFIKGEIYYEATFYRAVSRANKSDRIIAFTNIDISDKYATYLTLADTFIEVLNQVMPIKIIRYWEVSIRPCELNNFARLLDIVLATRRDTSEYRYLMQWLTSRSATLLDLVEMNDDQYEIHKAQALSAMTQAQIFKVLDSARHIIKSKLAGHNILRYLMLRMNNQIIKSQLHSQGCRRLSHMKLKWGCIPFDDMPLCSSLIGHNPRYWDLVESIDICNQEHELLARHVKNNVEHNGVLYTPVKDLSEFEDVDKLVLSYNNNLYHSHKEERSIIQDKGHLFIKGYEDKAVSIIETLQQKASSGVGGYTQAVGKWLNESSYHIDDSFKKTALQQLFSESCVALIYGAAGTGKSTMVNHIAQYFGDKRKLFLAHTNPAIDNLKRKVNTQNSDFKTIKSHLYQNTIFHQYDLLVIDECSTVSNTDLISILNTNFRLLVLVGDVYQIESIQFGNWFEMIRAFMPNTAVFELETPYRTENNSLLEFWRRVREITDDITEFMARNNYSMLLDKTLFEARKQDEIILCLNYDGLYGINNINRFLQSCNPNISHNWRAYTYKVGDPILFHDSERFRPVIYNNLKGQIKNIYIGEASIQFEVELNTSVSELDVINTELEWVENSTVRFTVYESNDADDDDEPLNTSVPFQLAYAVSIHKAQGLEYESVKIVITDANEENISHSIFYTAVTRARQHLQIFWTPETEQRVISNLRRNSVAKDRAILTVRNGLNVA